MDMDYWRVARMAECRQPESADSAGGKWLMKCYNESKEFAENDNAYFMDNAHEIADGLVPIYTNELWHIWVDCGGYEFEGEYRDFTSHSDTGDTMNRAAMADCYEWAMNILMSIERRLD